MIKIKQTLLFILVITYILFGIPFILIGAIGSIAWPMIEIGFRITTQWLEDKTYSMKEIMKR